VAAAILIDATVIRAFLLPSLMTLLSAANWWTPTDQPEPTSVG
jgi:putative drug exporter of the RND superfamily